MHLMHLALACAAIVAAGDLPDLIVIPVMRRRPCGEIILTHHAVHDDEVFVVSGTVDDLVQQAEFWHPQPGEEVFIYTDTPVPRLIKTIRAYTFGVIRCVSEALPLRARTSSVLPEETGYNKK